jgi:hypothetical protein
METLVKGGINVFSLINDLVLLYPAPPKQCRMVRGSTQHLLIAKQNELLACPREGHVELAVDLAGFVGRDHEF